MSHSNLRSRVLGNKQTSLGGMESQALLMPNTPAFNTQLQHDICAALQISSFYCASRIQVVSTTNTTPVLANVDFYPSTETDTANSGPQSAQDLLSKFQTIPKAALSGLLATASVAGGTVTQKCADGSFRSSCPVATSGSSGSNSTAWYIPVIVVVVVVVVIGLLLAAYFIRRRHRPAKQMEASKSVSNNYEPPALHEPETPSVPVEVATGAPAVMHPVGEEDANLPVSHVDYPAPTPGLKFMYTTPEWEYQSPSAETDQMVKSTPRDVHVNLDEDHQGHPDHA